MLVYANNTRTHTIAVYSPSHLPLPSAPPTSQSLVEGEVRTIHLCLSCLCSVCMCVNACFLPATLAVTALETPPAINIHELKDEVCVQLHISVVDLFVSVCIANDIHDCNTWVSCLFIQCPTTSKHVVCRSVSAISAAAEVAVIRTVDQHYITFIYTFLLSHFSLCVLTS